jgi:hypothetical protein
MELVSVSWIDAEDHKETWVDEEDAQKFGEAECKITSIGFLVRKTSKYLTLAADWDESSKNWGRVSKIPAMWVQKVTTLIESEPPTEAMGQ